MNACKMRRHDNDFFLCQNALASSAVTETGTGKFFVRTETAVFLELSKWF